MDVGEAIGLDMVAELKPVTGDHTYENDAVPVTVAVSCTEVPLQMVTPPPLMLTVGPADEMPENTVEPVLVTLVAVRVFELLLAALYFIHGSTPVYLPIEIAASDPLISAVR